MASIAPSPAPKRRTAKTPKPTDIVTPAKAQKKIPEATIETTAETFLTLFKALPSAIQWRVVQKIEDYEEGLEMAQLDTDMATNPEDYDRKNAVPWEHVKAEMDAQSAKPRSRNAQKLVA